ncbi:MAG TPA: TonB-dependent receptor plug domain-containing protein, partial [Leptospiraceae bacterium]|nr:TonB-dependent receptor plug domain-containing protein [Leptospiraceae bacterium]
TGYYTFRIIDQDKVYQIRKEIRFENEAIAFYAGDPPKEQPAQETVSDGINVVGKRDRTKLSRYTLSNEEIRRFPGVYGDSLKAVQSLPGISPAVPIGVLPSVNLITSSFLQSATGFSIGPPYSNSGSGFLVLRGAGARASQFYLDGFKILYPFHLGDQSSVLNNDIIRNVDVYIGTYPARYGNATGGVIAITGPDEVKKPTGHINVALFQSDAYYEVPFLDTGYFVGTARQSYPNYALLYLYPAAIPSNAKYSQYNDGQFKMGYKFNNNHTIETIYFGAHDNLKYTQSVAKASNGGASGLSGVGDSISSVSGGAGSVGDSNTDSRPPVGLNRAFDTEGARYIYTTGGAIKNTLTAQISRFKEDFQLDFRSPLTGETIFGYDVQNARHEVQYKDELNLELIRQHLILNLGGEANVHRWELSLKNFSPRSSTNPNTPSFVDTVNQLVENNRTFRALLDGDRTGYQLNAGFAELEADFWRFRLTPGVRVDHYSLSSSTGVGPRAGAEFKIPETGTTILGAAGRHFNVPANLEQISVEAGNPNLKMEESDHAAAGVQQTLGPLWLVKLEAYKNTFDQVVVADSYVVQPFALRTNRRDLLEKQAELSKQPFEARKLSYSNDGTGWSKGVEFYLKKSRPPGKNGFFGWLSYTWSITKRNNHQPRLTQTDSQRLNSDNNGRTPIAYQEFGKNALIYYNTGETYLVLDNDREELYDPDRTHVGSLVVNYKFNPEWQLGGRWKYSTGLPRTPVIGVQDLNLAILGRLTFIPKYSDFYNSERYPAVHQLDLRLDHFTNYEWGYANWYVELINVYAHRNVEGENFDFLYPYAKGSNPAYSYESTYIQTPIGGGRLLLLPLINIGLEMKF